MASLQRVHTALAYFQGVMRLHHQLLETNQDYLGINSTIHPPPSSSVPAELPAGSASIPQETNQEAETESISVNHSEANSESIPVNASPAPSAPLMPYYKVTDKGKKQKKGKINYMQAHQMLLSLGLTSPCLQCKRKKVKRKYAHNKVSINF